MNGENQPLHINWLSLRIDWFKSKTLGKLLIYLEESIEYSFLNKENPKMSTSSRLVLRTLGSQLIMPKTLTDKGTNSQNEN